MDSSAPEVRRTTMQVLRDTLTEENTDRVLHLIFSALRLPWWIPAAIVHRILDAMLPEVILGALEKVLGVDPESESEQLRKLGDAREPYRAP